MLHRSFLLIGVVVLLLSFVVSTQAAAPRARADATPDATPWVPNLRGPQQLCSDAERALFDAETMVSDLSMAVHLKGAPNQSAWMAFIELPAGACVGYHSHSGANIMYVQSGSIVYTAEPWQYTGPVWGTPVADGPTVRKGTVDDPGPTFEVDEADLFTWPDEGTVVPFGSPTSIAAGEWVTQNGMVYHTYRAGATDTVLIISGYAPDPSTTTPGCAGGCVGRGH